MKFLIILTLFLSGCSSVVIDIDPEQFERQLLKDNIPMYQSTPDTVIVGQKENIIIEVHKSKPIYDDQIKNYRERWRVFAINSNSSIKCISPLWRLMDFEYITYETSEFAVYPNKLKYIGEMIQKTWKLDGVDVALPPSGYLRDLHIRNPISPYQSGEECLFLVDDKDVEEQ